MTSPKTTPAIAAFAMLSLATTLVGCSAAAETPADTPPADGGTDSGTDAGTGSGTYTNGSYTESGSYQAPSGTETVEVTVTLDNGIITDLTVVGTAKDPEAKLHQGQFIAGIKDIVVGKSIDKLDVHKVGGSSLTSGGFNAAIETIKADAAA